MDLSVVPYNHSSTKPDINDSEYGDVVEPKPLDINNNNDTDNDDDPSPLSAFRVKYGECMKNHAASIGGHANDGCGEFMPRAGDGSGDSFTCAACGCHRNFHRRKLPGSDQHYPVHSPPPPPPPPPMLLYNAASTTPRWDPKMVIGSQRHHHHQHHYIHHRNRGRLIDHHDHHHHHHHHEDVEEREYDRRSETPDGEEVQVQVQVQQMGHTSRTTSCKRSRTKFTQEQKDRMLAFAEKIGWRIQRHDDVALNQFCSEVGVKRNVLKVWMHNNKNAHRRRESVPPPPPLLPEAPLPQPPPPPPSQPVGV